MEQISPFNPGFTLGELAESISKDINNNFMYLNKGTEHVAPVVAIAGGLGVFTPPESLP